MSVATNASRSFGFAEYCTIIFRNDDFSALGIMMWPQPENVDVTGAKGNNRHDSCSDLVVDILSGLSDRIWRACLAVAQAS